MLLVWYTLTCRLGMQAPLMVHASFVASQPVATPAYCAAVGEGYEAAHFCPDVRWRKDRSTRKLAAGGTATVYRSAFTYTNRLTVSTM